MRAFTIPTIFTAVNRFTPQVKAMTASMRTFMATSEAGLASMERAWRALRSPIDAVNKSLRYFGYFFGGAAIVIGLRSVISIMGDFEQAQANLHAVMTENDPRMMAQLKDQAKILGITTARTATQVTQLQEELAKLGYTGNEMLAMTKSLVAGSIAMDAELDRTATLGGAMVRTFQNFTAMDMPMIMDQMTQATLDTALSFEKLETMLPIVSGAANAVNISFSRQLALLGKLSDAGIDASSSATALRNIFIDSRRRGHSYDQVLGNIVKHADMLTPAFNKFGKRGAVSAVVLANKLKETLILENRIINSVGVSEVVAKKRLDTIYGSWTLLKAAWQGLILTIDDGTGKYSKLIRSLVDTARGLLLLTAGTKEAMETFAEMSPEIQSNAKQWRSWINIAWHVIQTIIIFKIAMVAWRVAFVAWSIAMGVMSAITMRSSILIAGNTIAIHAQTIALWAAATAARAFSLALALSPYFILATAIAAVAFGLYKMIENWHKWGAAVSIVLGPLGLVISMIQSFRRNWDAIVSAFSRGGLVAGLKQIGKALMDALIMPIQQFYKLLSHMPGTIGESAGKMAQMMEAVRNQVGVNTKTDESGRPLVGPAAQPGRFERDMIETGQQNVSIDIRDSTGRASVKSDNNLIPVRVSSTMGFGVSNGMR